MKKSLLIFFIIFLFPLNIFAYSNYLIPGGDTIGIEIDSKGLVVVGFYKVNNEYIGKEYLKVGDSIIKINGLIVNNIEDLTNIVDKEISNEINITIKRNNKIIDTKMNIELENSLYKTGLYIKDSIVGIGTLTYIDPITKIFGALGHEIAFSETNTRVEVRNGNILESKVIGINKSSNGHVGSKNASINFKSILGNINKNSEFGIYGVIHNLPNKNVVEISDFSDIHKGDASILTVTNDNNIKEYKINIIDIYKDKIKSTKSFSFEIKDESLLERTGGIVQGMSGSPIIQDNKIIGGVTHVLVDRVNLGYGIYIKTMLEEGEK